MQDFEKRNHVTVYLPVTQEVRELGPDNDRKKIETKLVLCVSNFHFNRTASTVKQTLVCLPKDCKVSLKFSSDKFASKNPASGATEEDFHFDKSGLTVSYGAFMGLLLTSGKDTEAFWNAIVSNYSESAGQDLVSLTSEAIEEEDQPDDGKKRKRAAGGPLSKKIARGSGRRVRDDEDEEEAEDEEDVQEVESEHVNGEVGGDGEADESAARGNSNRANLDGPAGVGGSGKKSTRR